jgi:hypothetical protein
MASQSSTSSGPFTVMVSNLSFGSGLISVSVQRLTCPRQRPFGPSHPGWYPAGYPRQPAEGPTITPWFPVAFRPPAFASWASCSRRGVPLPSRSAYQAACTWTRQGFHVPHIRVTAGLGALFTPRPSGALTPGPIPPAAACPLCQGPGPLAPVLIPSPRAVHYEASSRVHSRSPARPSPSPVIPGWNEDLLGLSPGLRTPQAGPAAHARAGDGHRALARSYTTDIVGPPIRELARDVRPRVARSAWT